MGLPARYLQLAGQRLGKKLVCKRVDALDQCQVNAVIFDVEKPDVFHRLAHLRTHAYQVGVRIVLKRRNVNHRDAADGNLSGCGVSGAHAAPSVSV